MCKEEKRQKAVDLEKRMMERMEGTQPLSCSGKLKMTIPVRPKSRNQKYFQALEAQEG